MRSLYKTLARGAGIPRILWDGRKDNIKVMVFDLLGPSLEDLFQFCGRETLSQDSIDGCQPAYLPAQLHSF